MLLLLLRLTFAKKDNLLPLSYLTLGLHNVGTDVERLVLALLDKDRVTDLPVTLHPDHRLEGGHVHTELLQDGQQV